MQIRTDLAIGIAQRTPRYMRVLVEANRTIIRTPVAGLIEEIFLHRTSLTRDGEHVVLRGVLSRVCWRNRYSDLARETDVEQEINEMLDVLPLANTRLHAELKTSCRG
jgi:hypothetical protein